MGLGLSPVHVEAVAGRKLVHSQAEGRYMTDELKAREFYEEKRAALIAWGEFVRDIVGDICPLGRP